VQRRKKVKKAGTVFQSPPNAQKSSLLANLGSLLPDPLRPCPLQKIRSVLFDLQHSRLSKAVQLLAKL
jgi:hypothetical protein